jgi:hypothetical protein
MNTAMAAANAEQPGQQPGNKTNNDQADTTQTRRRLIGWCSGSHARRPRNQHDLQQHQVTHEPPTQTFIGDPARHHAPASPPPTKPAPINASERQVTP